MVANFGRIDNRWTGGRVDLVFPPLPPEEVGVSGARFLELEFQPGQGEELFLRILEEPQWARKYGGVQELTVVATTLAVITDAGPIAIILWRFARGLEALVHYEHYLDALDEPTRRMLRDIENQARLKIILRDNRSGATEGFWEFDNNFAMGEFAEALSNAFKGRPAGPFQRRVDLVKEEYRIEDLIEIARRQRAVV